MPDLLASPGSHDFDFGQKWSPVPDWSTTCVDRPTLSVRPVSLARVTAVNGLIDVARTAASIPVAPVGWPEIASGDAYAVRLSRDSALLIGGQPLAEGWHEDGYSVSNATDAAIIVEASGSGMPDFLSRGMPVTFDTPSPSAAFLFGGFSLVVYRHERPDRARIHCPRHFGPAFWKWAQDTSASLARP